MLSRIVIAVLVVMFGMVCGTPIADGYDQAVVPQPRITCDLLSFLSLGDTACAAHCLVLGYKGGFCDSNKVCNCRN
jgi:Arthropod defensin